MTSETETVRECPIDPYVGLNERRMNVTHVLHRSEWLVSGLAMDSSLYARQHSAEAAIAQGNGRIKFLPAPHFTTF